MTIDTELAVMLVFGVPALALWREVSGGHHTRIARYRAATLTIAALLGVLALRWVATGRSAAVLGLALPPTTLGWACLVGAVTVLVVIGVALRRKPRVAPYGDAADPLPRTREERFAFIVFAVSAGCGWEILYRGFLMYLLVPKLGSLAAICVAALAYGLAHGVRDSRKAIASIASAFLFTIGFALTHDLWWLMLIHAGLPLLAVWASPPIGATGGLPFRERAVPFRRERH